MWVEYELGYIFEQSVEQIMSNRAEGEAEFTTEYDPINGLIISLEDVPVIVICFTEQVGYIWEEDYETEKT